MNKGKIYLIILGPPGSGKGTQAKALQKDFGLFYFGTGDLMREEAKKGTPLGEKFQAVWDRGKGELVSDDLVDELVQNKMREIDAPKGIVFDGYPRTEKQAEKLSEILKLEPKDLYVINFEVSDEELIKRMQTRKVCQKCGKIFFRPEENGITSCDRCGSQLVQRQEDQPETVKKRIAVYKEQTAPLILYYKTHGTLVNIDGNPPIEEVNKDVENKVREIIG